MNGENSTPIQILKEIKYVLIYIYMLCLTICFAKNKKMFVFLWTYLKNIKAYFIDIKINYYLTFLHLRAPSPAQ